VDLLFAGFGSTGSVHRHSHVQCASAASSSGSSWRCRGALGGRTVVDGRWTSRPDVGKPSGTPQPPQLEHDPRGDGHRCHVRSLSAAVSHDGGDVTGSHRQDVPESAPAAQSDHRPGSHLLQRHRSDTCVSIQLLQPNRLRHSQQELP